MTPNFLKQRYETQVAREKRNSYLFDQFLRVLAILCNVIQIVFWCVLAVAAFQFLVQVQTHQLDVNVTLKSKPPSN